VEQEIRFCTAPDGVRLAYATHGMGPPVVKVAHWFTHIEFDWHSPVWRHWWEEFGATHRVVRYDMRGCGLSDREPQRIDLDAFVADLEAVVDAARLGRFALLGISQGGATAIRYAIRHPDRVSHLVLCGASARGRLKWDLLPEQHTETQLLQSIVRSGWGAATPVFRRVFASLLMPDATEQQSACLEQLMRISVAPQTAGRIRDTWAGEDVTALLAQVDLPALVAHARDDQAVPFSEGRLLAARLPDAQFLPLDSNNHSLLGTEPAWRIFVDRARAFLGSSAPRAAPSTALTDREREVLRLVAEGLSNAMIGDQLSLSTRTVERHISNIYVKLDVSGKAARAAAAAYLARAEDRR
jgi:pimeloyl-ACP methyl ester carboxylesterase/DNA-binding CsgD family transcriptional regulator